MRRLGIVGGVKKITVYRMATRARQRYVGVEYRRDPRKNDAGEEYDPRPFFGQLTPGQAEHFANLLEAAAKGS